MHLLLPETGHVDTKKCPNSKTQADMTQPWKSQMKKLDNLQECPAKRGPIVVTFATMNRPVWRFEGSYMVWSYVKFTNERL